MSAEPKPPTEYNPWGKNYAPGVSHDMKNVRGVGPVYFVMHRQRPVRRIMRAEMREIDPPYRWGHGVEIRLFGRTLQVGVCRRQRFDSPYAAVREAVGGHDISPDDTTEATSIGDWSRGDTSSTGR